MRNTGFSRLLGDIGNPDTFDGQVIYEIVELATVPEVVSITRLDSSLKAEFRRATRKLEKRGATVIGTSCGFLISMQDDLHSEVSIPVSKSAIILMPAIRQRHIPFSPAAYDPANANTAAMTPHDSLFNIFTLVTIEFF